MISEDSYAGQIKLHRGVVYDVNWLKHLYDDSITGLTW